MSIENVIEKVKKLLALSKSSNVNEAANATAAANRLIDEYRLSEADVTGNDPALDPMIEDDSYIYETGRKIPWKHTLVDTLANHYGCAYFNDNHFPKGRIVNRYKLVGRKSDIQIVKYMFAYLTSECARLADLNVKGKGKVVVFSYCNGFVAGIAEQLFLSRKEVEKTADSNAIVKINARGEEAEVFKKQKHPGLVTMKSKSYQQYDKDAYLSGKDKGKNLHLGNVVGGGTVKLLGGK